MFRFKLLRNYYSRQEDSISTYSNTLDQTRRDHSHGFIIHPQNSRWYIAWTHFILIWAVYSSFFTPLEFAFFRGLPENLFLLDIAGQFTFLIDIILSFFVGFRDPHSHCMVDDRTRIAIRYLKSRFPVDLLGCLPWDAIYKACGRKEPVRYMLWIRLSRALRVTEFFEKLEKDIRINYLFTRIIKLFVVELYCTHTAACVFYYLATTLPPSEEGNTWIGSLQLGDYSYENFRHIDLWTRYITALYFAVVTMATVGYGEIHAVNTREMIFVMVYVSFDMILGAYLLGNMTALIVKGSKTEKFRDKMGELIKYMNKNKLGKNISQEIKGHVRLQYESNPNPRFFTILGPNPMDGSIRPVPTGRSYTDAAALRDLPLALRAKISNKLYEPYVREVPLFKGCSDEFIKKVAINVHEEYFLPGEVIVEEGSNSDHLYFLYDGKLDGVRNHEETRLGHVPSIQIYSSIGDVSVLCDIPEPRTVQTTELSKLLRIDKQALTEIIETYFSDGRTVIDNLLEGREDNLRNKISESTMVVRIEKREMESATRLNFAANDGDLRALRRLFEAGADPNKTDYNGQSPLHRAASNGHEDIVRFLIERKVDVNLRDDSGKTALFEAIKNGHDSISSALAEAGATLSTVENAGNLLCEAVARKEFGFLTRLLANGINPNSKNYDLRTPLHLAASQGSYAECVLLVETGASVFATDRWGRTPVDEARVGGNRELVKLLEDAKLMQMSQFSCCYQNQGTFLCDI
ncbi:hypothetical protein ABFS82_04G119700 [Erythranthe guttata]